MKKIRISGALLLLAGLVMVLLPIHMAMTGLILLLLGAAVLLGAFLWHRPNAAGETLASVLAVLASGALICLMAVMGLIITSGQADWTNARASEYAVVLGAGVHKSGQPSRILGTRIHAAMTFMEENPKAVVILSGGRGADEPITEAECMYHALVALGADPERLVLEDESHTTRENLINSMAIMEEKGGTDQEITLITSEFHHRRAAYIAQSLDLEVCAVPAKTPWFYRVNYTLREVFAFVKAFLQS